MAYFATGYAFGSEPAWERIQRSLPQFHLRGYKHKERELWMLDAWQTRFAAPHEPFGDGPPSPHDFAVKAQPVPEAVALFDRIEEALGEWWGSRVYGADWLLVPWSVASAAGVPTFAFIADDESYDFAALVAEGAFVRVGCRVGLLDVVLDGESFRIVPYSDEDDEPLAPELLDKLASLPGVRLSKPAAPFDSAFYSQPAGLWPAEWGDGEKLLGLGTWDPLLNFEQTFALVYQANPPALPAPPAKPAKPTPEPSNDIGLVLTLAAVLWPIGIFLACGFLLRSERRKALVTGILAAAGLLIAIGLEQLERHLPPALVANNATVLAYLIAAAGAALGLRAWMKRLRWTRGPRRR
jgi:hypothetical protein